MKDRLLLFVHGLGGAGQATWRDRRYPGFAELISADGALRELAEAAFFEYPTSYRSAEYHPESEIWRRACVAKSKYGIPSTNRLRLSAIVWAAWSRGNT